MEKTQIRLIDKSEINKVMEIITDAIKLLGKNSLQWQQGYPNEKIMLNDIINGNLYGYYIDSFLVGVVSLVKGIDINYTEIYQGNWIIAANENDLTIHRIAIRENFHQKGIGKALIKFAIDKAKLDPTIKSIKLDTHVKNIPMQQISLKNGFEYRGIIYIKRDEVDNSRLAYELIV